MADSKSPDTTTSPFRNVDEAPVYDIDKQHANTVGDIPAVQAPVQPHWHIRAASLQAEYVSGGGYIFLANYIRSLPHSIDDTTRDFGDDLYERMLLDPQVNSSLRLLKLATLANGVRLEPAVDLANYEEQSQTAEELITTGSPFHDPDDKSKQPKDDTWVDQTGETNQKNDAELAQEITEFCESCIEHLDRAFIDVLYEMLDGLALGNKVAEQVYALDTDKKGVQKLRLKALKVKPRVSTAFVVDAYMNTLGLLALLPGKGYPVVTGSIVGDPAQLPNMLPREKFAIFTWAPVNGDPRGSALDPETPIPTPDGWRKMGDLRVGDKVFGDDGKIRYVVAVKEWEDRPCYRLNFRDGTSIIADENHKWLTQTRSDRNNGAAGKIRTTLDIVNTTDTSARQANHSIPWAGPLDYAAQVLPVAPYYLGLWLGDGDSATAHVACHVQDAEETAAYITACGYTASVVASESEDGNGRQIRVSGKHKWDSAGPSHALRVLGVLNNKHVPSVYLRGSIQQRRDLLAGLMDSDGSINDDGGCVFVNTNADLVKGVAELVRSLGIGVVVREPRATAVGCQDAWSLCFTPDWSPFRLARKAAKVRTDRNRKNHYIASCERVANRRTVCIEVDSPSHLFLAGENMAISHNSLLRPIYNPWWLKMQCFGEYAKYLAQFAGPSLIGYTAPGAQSVPPTDSLGNPIPGASLVTPEQAMLNALLAFRNGTAVAFPYGAKVEPLSVGGDGGAFQKAIELFDHQIAKGILGQTLATEQGIYQARAAAQTHQDVLDLVILQIKYLLGVMVFKDILVPLVRYNWGEDVARRLTPRVHLAQIERHNWAQDAAAIASLTTSQFLDTSQFKELDVRLGLPQRHSASAGENGEAAQPSDPVQPKQRGKAGGPSGKPPTSEQTSAGEGGQAPGDDTTGDMAQAPVGMSMNQSQQNQRRRRVVKFKKKPPVCVSVGRIQMVME